MAHRAKVRPLRKVLPQQSVRVLVRGPLIRLVGLREIHPQTQRAFQFPKPRKLRPVVQRQRLAKLIRHFVERGFPPRFTLAVRLSDTLAITTKRLMRSTAVTKCPDLPATVSPSQSTLRLRFSTSGRRCSIPTRPTMPPRCLRPVPRGRRRG